LNHLKSAIVFGSSGLVGLALLEQLLNDDRYKTVKILVRKSIGIKHPKLDELIIDFNKFEDFRDQVTGDDLFCCLGTTLHNAGSAEAFRKVDFEWVRCCAVYGCENGIKNFIVVSSVGANANSKNLYLRTKGEMEKAIAIFKFQKLVILRPSILLGDRKTFRLGEVIGKFLVLLFSFLIPKRYKGVAASVVAATMVNASNHATFEGVIENEQIISF